MPPKAIGSIELSSVAKGVEVSDAMLKRAEVKLLISGPVCPGKFLIVIGGDVASVRSSVETGRMLAGSCLVDTIVIPNVHSDVFPAISQTTRIEKIGAIGVLETFSLPSCVIAADAAVKAAAIDLIEIRLARALGGKAFVTLTGEVAAVKAAVEAGKAAIKDSGLLLGIVVIPSPHPDLIPSLM